MEHTYAKDLPQNEWLSTGSDFAPSLQGTLGKVRIPFWLSQLREGAATGILYVEVRDAANHPTISGKSSTTKKYLVLSVSGLKNPTPN